MFSTLVYNLTIGKARRETWQGREWLVAPLTSIVPGVLAGSKGRLYYPPDEIARNVKDWDGMPLTVGHPTAANGDHLSAGSADVVARQGIGVARNSRTQNGKLKHEGWFDVVATKRVDKQMGTDVYDRLNRGQPIELSTGLFTDNEDRSGIAPNGDSFDGIARNYRPDHIAILPHAVGACSNRDGCGVFAANAQDPASSKFTSGKDAGLGNPHEDDPDEEEEDMQKAAKLAMLTGNEAPQSIVGRFLSWMFGTTHNANPEGHNQYGAGGSGKLPAVGSKVIHGGMLHTVHAHNLDDPKNPTLTIGHPRNGLKIVKPHEVEGTSLHNAKLCTCGGTMNAKGLCDNCGATMAANAGPNQQRHVASGQYLSHGASIGTGDVHEAAKQGIAHLTEAQKKVTEGNEVPGVPIKGTDEQEDDDPPVAKEVQNAARKVSTTGNKSMPTREQIITQLITNGCACEQDRAALSQLTSRTLNALPPAFLKAKKKSEGVADDEEDDDEMEYNADGSPVVKADLGKQELRGGSIAGMVQPSDADSEEEPVDGVGPTKGKPKPVMAANRWLAQAPPEIRNAVQNAMEIEKRERVALVQRLVANVADDDQRKGLAKMLYAKPLGELRALLQLAAPVQNETYAPMPEPTFNYTGAAGVAPGYGLTENESMDVLDLDEARKAYDPVYNKRNYRVKGKQYADNDE